MRRAGLPPAITQYGAQSKIGRRRSVRLWQLRGLATQHDEAWEKKSSREKEIKAYTRTVTTARQGADLPISEIFVQASELRVITIAK